LLGQQVCWIEDAIREKADTAHGATPDRLNAGGTVGSSMSGCFVISSHRWSYVKTALTGRRWLVSPEGEILGKTSAGTLFLTIEVDVEKATRAKSTYARALAVP
jgi:hypothetical protein